MPTYEYRCKDCSHTFDAYQAFSDDALTECPECGGALKKLFGNVGISFKGSGFYKNDSRGGSSSSSSGDSSAAGSGGSDSAKATDSSSGGSTTDSSSGSSGRSS